MLSSDNFTGIKAAFRFQRRLITLCTSKNIKANKHGDNFFK